MPSGFLSSDTVEYLKRNSNNQSMDSTVRRLLNLDKNKGKLVKRQVGRTKLAPIEAYTWTIIYRLYMLKMAPCPEKHFRDKFMMFCVLGDYLRLIQMMMLPPRTANPGGNSGITAPSPTSGRTGA